MAISWRAVALVLLGVVPATQWPQAATVWWWALAVLVVLAADLALAPSPGTLQFVRSAPEQIRLGESAVSTVTVTNPGRRTIRGVLRDAWTPSAGADEVRHRLQIAGGERRRIRTRLSPTRRGDRTADHVTVRIWGPLGLAARQRSAQIDGSIRVLPAFRSRRHLPSRLAHLRQIDGRSAVRTRGQGTEFDSLRDYVDGDDVRSIDWRATARRRSVVVRTWQPERDRRVIIVLDTARTSAARVGDEPRLDAAMDAALLLSALASRAGDRVDLIAGDRRIRGRVAPDTDRTALLNRMVEVMAPIEPVLVEADWSLLAGTVTRLTRRRALVVLLTSLDSAAVEDGLIPALPTLTAHHRVVLASVADPELARMRQDLSDLDRVYDAAAAERTIALRARTGQALERLGVHVLDEDPEKLPPALADLYLRFKANGLL